MKASVSASGPLPNRHVKTSNSQKDKDGDVSMVDLTTDEKDKVAAGKDVAMTKIENAPAPPHSRHLSELVEQLAEQRPSVQPYLVEFGNSAESHVGMDTSMISSPDGGLKAMVTQIDRKSTRLNSSHWE